MLFLFSRRDFSWLTSESLVVSSDTWDSREAFLSFSFSRNLRCALLLRMAGKKSSSRLRLMHHLEHHEGHQPDTAYRHGAHDDHRVRRNCLARYLPTYLFFSATFAARCATLSSSVLP